MRKSLITLVALAMVVAFAVPTMAAGLKVLGGLYTDNYIAYENGEITFDPGTLYIGFVLTEGKSIVAQIITGFELQGMVGFGTNVPWDLSEWSEDVPGRILIAEGSYIAYKGDPFVVSLATKESPDEYLLANPGEPLGMARMDQVELDNGHVVFKVAGKVQNVGITAMMDHNWVSNEDIAALRLTTDAVPGYTVGALYATKATGAADTVANFGVDLSGSLPLAQGGTMNVAIGQSRTQSGSGWGEGQNAYWLGASGYKIGGVTLSGDFRAVDPEFNEVIAETDDPKSLVYEYKGQRQIFGKLVTDLNLGGQKGTLTVSNDYRINFDGTKKVTGYVKPQNTISASYAFSPMKDLSLEVGGSYAKCLSSQDDTDNDNYDDDAATTVYAKLNPYTIAPNVTAEGNVTWKRENRLVDPDNDEDLAGAGTKLEGKVTLTPLSNVSIEGSAKYGTGTYDFFDDAPVLSAQSRLDVGVYGKAEQKLTAPGVKEATTILAGAIGAHKVGTADQKTYNVGYAEANLKLTDKLSSRNAILVGNKESTDYEPDEYIDYGQIMYTGLSYAVSGNSTATVAYTIREDASGSRYKNWYAEYKIVLGRSDLLGEDTALTLSYGESRLNDPDDDDFNSGKPWAWLSTLGGGSTTPLYKVAVTIPF